MDEITTMVISQPAGDRSAAGASPAAGFYEVTLEVKDLGQAERFYAGIIGLPVVARWGEDRPAVWLNAGGGGFLGLWSVAAGGDRAIHGGRGGRHVHFALQVHSGTLRDLAIRIEATGYTTEWQHFDNGNVALYVDDPDGNVLELTEIIVRWDGTSDRDATHS